MDAVSTSCFNTLYTERIYGGSHSMHMNWGWGGLNDGYFSENWKVTVSSGTYNLSKERRAIINLN
ncbi:MAG: C10 family peptidase [Muribaculaceae bacterium]|nr:C10 family peptidase [Muribaculaceae bacterium]